MQCTRARMIARLPDFTTAPYSRDLVTDGSAWKADEMASKQRFCGNFRLPLTVDFLAPTKGGLHVSALGRKARKQGVSRFAGLLYNQKLLLNRSSTRQ